MNAVHEKIKNLMEVKGALSVDMGRGWLSRFEAANLAIGDVIISTHLAGDPIAVSYNGHFFGECAVVVLGDIFGARLLSLQSNHQSDAEPDRGDEATELLPFAIRIADVAYTLSELAGLGPNSIIHLDAAVDGPEQASLVIAGVCVGKGVVSVCRENMALRLTRISADLASSAAVRTTGACLRSADASHVKTYDFRRPDSVTWQMIQTLDAIHQEFLRSLQMLYPQAREIKLDSCDQLTFGEWVAAKDPAACQLYVQQASAGSQSSPNRSAAVAIPRKLTLSPEKPRFPEISAETKQYFLEYIQRNQENESSGICFLSAPSRLQTLLPQIGDRDQLRSCQRNGWKRFADLRFSEKYTLKAGWKPADALAHCGEHEMILMAVFAIAGPQGLEWMELIYPLASLRGLTKLFGG